MKEFFSALFFGHSILLTPVPVAIGQNCIEIKPKNILEAVNGGAVLEIRFHPGKNGTPQTIDIVAAPQELEKLYPTGTVSATLYRADGSKVTALNTDVATGKDFYALMLRPPAVPNSPPSVVPAFQEGDKFARATVCSKILISDVQIYWQTSME